MGARIMIHGAEKEKKMCKIVHEEITTNHWWDPFNWLIKSIPYLFFLFFIPILLSLINHIHFFRDDHFRFSSVRFF